MKISVLIPSCGRESLYAVIGSLHGLASGRNEVRYCIGTEDHIPLNRHPGAQISQSIAPRPNGLGSVVNRLAAENPADIYVPFADDIFPLTAGWDELIALVHRQSPHSIFAWLDTAQPGVATHQIIPHSWYALNDNSIYTDYFPYWFEDTWLTEVYKMATGEDIVIPQQLMFGGKKGKTNNMMDLAFWWDFFSRTRKIRMEKARELHDKGGFSNNFDADCEQVIRAGIDRDKAFRSRIASIEAAGSSGGATEAYRAAKRHAEAILKERGYGEYAAPLL